MKRALISLFAFGLVACGDVYISSVPNTPGEGDEAAPRVATGQTIPQDTLFSCPDARPDENTECQKIGATCEYGDSPDISCNTTLACEGDESGLTSAWTPRPSQLCSLAQCPSGDIDSISGQPCDLPSVDGGAPSDTDELQCPMSDGVCACTVGPDAAHGHTRMWVCVRPDLDCPATRPRAGQACEEDTLCDYGSCLFKHGVRMQCKDGVWLTGGSSSCG